MFHLYQSNKVETLLAQLIRLLIEQERPPLESQTIVVENPGLAHWLKMQLANSLGIAANIEFPMPSRFFWQVQRALQPDLQQESVFSKDTLTWLVLECLENETLLNRPHFSLLKDYLAQELGSEQQTELNAYQLASSIADLYDQYLVHRPDWIENWEQGNFTFDDAPLGEHQWQGEMWQALLKLAQEKSLPTHHRGNLLQNFLEVLSGKVDSADFSQLPSDLIFFGFSTLPKHQIDALNLLSKHCNVHVLTPNPCQQYWGDVVDETVQARLRLRNKSVELLDAGNDLLASLGSMGKDYQRMLLDVDDIQEYDLFSENESGHVLAQIQNQILKLQKDEPLNWQADDHSIQVVGCHSPMREIEVLHNHLLDSFSQGELDPQDVVVMIPDVASYAPYIDAVFNSSDPYVPYSISDRPVQAEHPLLSAFLLILGLPKGRFSFSDVTSLLEIPAVYRAYGLQEHQLPQLKVWLREAGIRWGFDENQRQQQGLPAWKQNTWLYGFKRLLMGYAVSGEQVVEGISAVGSVEGLDAQWLGPVMDFVDDLHQFMIESDELRTASSWSGYVLKLVEKVFLADEQEQPIMEHIYEALESWVETTHKVHYQRDIAFSVLADGLNQRLQATGGSQHFMVGKVNFCTLLPMRSIPFKMVAVLGLNDADYPRSVIPNSLDLMRFNRRLGDRSRRDEDRYLFLEALLSARESLWLSYKSRDQKDDKPLTPSVVLAELMDYLQNSVEESQYFQQHPLQPFNKSYFSQTSNLFSYNHDWLAVHSDTADVSENTMNTDSVDLANIQELLVDDLVQFYQHSSKYFLNKVLNVNLSIWTDEQEDDEPFELDGLTAFQLKQKLLEKALVGDLQMGHEATSVSVAEGHLAFGEIGQKQWNKIESSLQPLLAEAEGYLEGDAHPPFEMNIKFESLNIQLLDWQKQVIGDHLVMILPNKLKAKVLLPLIIQMAVLSAMDKRYKGVLICQDHLVSLKPMDRSVANEYLLNLVTHYLEGLNEPLGFMADTAWELIRPVKKGGKSYNNESNSQKVFWGSDGPFGFAGERDDIHHRRCITDLSTIPQRTIDLANQVFGPWIELMEVVEHDS